MDLDSLFYPKSVAVIGASDSLGGGKVPYFQLLQASGYKGDLYPVNPRHSIISGVKAYATIDDLPEGIDFAIVAAPVQQSLEIIKAAARKKIKFVHFFASGFGETGNRQLEEDLVREAHKGGVRIVGPNCLGVYCTESGLGFGNNAQRRVPGAVAFLGQSGGLTGNFMSMATTRKIRLNKAVSYGNQIDLTVEDYLEYFADDKNIRLIACYIEDIKDMGKFLKVLKLITATKPVIILKGGRTETGSRAAASHTGAMASDYTIWAAAVRQHGALLVDNFEQMINLVMLGTGKKAIGGKRVGFLSAGGGFSVIFTDLAGQAGLSLPELKEETQKMISEKIQGVNTSTTNPVDLGAFGFDLNVMFHTMKALDRDENIDVIIPYFSVEYIMRSESFVHAKNTEQTFTDMANEIKKPIIPVLTTTTEDNIDIERARISTFAALRNVGFTTYAKMQDAVYSIGVYFEWVAKQEARKKEV